MSAGTRNQGGLCEKPKVRLPNELKVVRLGAIQRVSVQEGSVERNGRELEAEVVELVAAFGDDLVLIDPDVAVAG